MAAYNKNNMLNLMCRLLCNYILIIDRDDFQNMSLNVSTYCDAGTKQQAPDSSCLIAAKLIANLCVRFPRLYYHSHTSIQTLQGGWAGWNQEPTKT